MHALRYTLGIYICMLLGFNTIQSHDLHDPWTWLYYRSFSEQELEMHKDKPHIFFAKEDIPLFTQLVFSWNARRPASGYLSFWVQVRQAQTGTWGSWHRMFEWGQSIQRSHASKSDGIASYHHVRLEVDSELLADAFRIKATVHDGASLDMLKACAVSISNSNNFKSEMTDQSLIALPSLHIRAVPTLSQFALDHPKNDAICSPTSCSMLTSFLGDQKVDPCDFAEKSFDDGLGVYGSWPFNMAHAFERCQGEFNFFTARFNTFAQVHARLRQGIPVVVSVRGPLEGAAGAYKHGHLLVVVGWDAKKQEVIVHDPAFKKDRDTLHRYPLKDFLESWERSRRLAYVAERVT